MTTLVANSDLLTPARPDASSNESLLQSDAASSSHPQHQSSAPAPSSNTVTPPDSKDAASLKDDKSIDSTADAATMGNISHSSNINHKTADGSDSNTNKDALSKRGLVSRRGRHVSAGRRTSPRPPSDQLQALAQVTVDAAGNSSGSYDSPMPPKNSVTFSPKKEAGDDSETTANEPNSSSPCALTFAPLPKLDDDDNHPKSLNSPTSDAFMAPLTPCRNRDDEETKHNTPRQCERELYATTPTDFALDYGKPYPSTFDSANVLSWLHSPNPNHLFSPGGGLASMLNSPRNVPRTPRTPTISTSFFFSDVASLPKNNKNNQDNHLGGCGGGESSSNGNNIICISPLASKTNTNTPMNLKDVFNSPRAGDGRLPMLSDTPLKKSHSCLHASSMNSKDTPNIDAVHLAERDLMEDEDLSVLLQLAANTTPMLPGASEPVFRSPSRQDKNNDLPGLHLPMIGGRNDDKDTRKMLRQKSSSREEDDGGLAPPQLGMRSHSNGGSNEFYTIGTGITNVPDKTKSGSGKLGVLDSKGKAIAPASGVAPVGKSPYPVTFNGQDLAPFYKMAAAGGMPQSIPPGVVAGSLRVVVGGPPPPNSHPDAMPQGGASAPANGTSLYHGNYSNGMPSQSFSHRPGGGMYPPHSQFGAHGYQFQQHQGHYPPPPAGRSHVPLFGSPHSLDAKSDSKNKTGKASGAAKRSPDGLSNGSPNKKPKKSKGDGSSGKKKNRSPQVADKQKCAEKILAVNAASGGKHDKEAELAAAIMRGVTMRPSGKWQAQLYFAGKSRYIGVFDSREKAALAYEIAREKLKAGPKGDNNPKTTENLVNLARKAAFDGVNEKLPVN